MTTGQLAPFPPRRYATGVAFLRGQGHGRVRAVHGLDRIQRDLGGLITDTRLPRPGHLRHAETCVVEEALRHIITNVRVELG